MLIAVVGQPNLSPPCPMPQTVKTLYSQYYHKYVLELASRCVSHGGANALDSTRNVKARITREKYGLAAQSPADQSSFRRCHQAVPFASQAILGGETVRMIIVIYVGARRACRDRPPVPEGFPVCSNRAYEVIHRSELSSSCLPSVEKGNHCLYYNHVPPPPRAVGMLHMSAHLGSVRRWSCESFFCQLPTPCTFSQ